MSYLMPWDVTLAVSYTGNAGPWSGPPLGRLAADDPQITQYGPGSANNGFSNPLATRYRIIGADRGELQVQAPTVHTVGFSLGKIVPIGPAQFELSAQVFNPLDAADHNQFTQRRQLRLHGVAHQRARAHSLNLPQRVLKASGDGRRTTVISLVECHFSWDM